MTDAPLAAAPPRAGAAPLVAVLAGAAAALGQAPWNLWWLALPAFAVLLRAVARAPHPVLAAWLGGLAHFVVALHWIAEPFLVDAAVTGWLAPVAVAATCAGMALFWAAGAGGGRRLLGGPLGAAVGLGLAELLRSYLLTGFPWALPGHVLIGSPALPAASLLGAHGLGLLVLLGAGAAGRGTAGGLLAAAALWAAPLVVGTLLPPAPPPEAEAPVVRLIQPNAPQHLKWDPDWIATFFERGLALSQGSGRFDAVVWPETALPRLLESADDLRPMLARASRGAPVAIGVQRIDEGGAPRNAMALLEGPEGALAHVYDKHRLVPFGEFLPLPGLFAALGFGPLASQLAGAFASGPGAEVFALPGIGPVLPLICYEAIFPQDLVRLRPRPRVVLHLTNDAWFGAGAGPRQHLALTRLRAAESGLPVLRAANTGISAAIDARGRVLAALPLNEAGVLDAPAPPALPPTPYGRTGDWPAFGAFLALALGLLAANRQTRRA